MRLIVVDNDVRIDPTDPDLRLTETQRAALATDRELVVTAGAGTGKTQTLSLRYTALLLALANRGESDVERVLVLTFTEKAAHEMAERCHRQLQKLIAAARQIGPSLEEGRGAALVASLEKMEDDFDRARIGTFHGFCARLLREFPSETATPPGAAPLPAGEAARWSDAALGDTLDVHLATDPGDLEPLLDAFGTRAGLLDAGRIALDRLGILDELLLAHADGRIQVDALLRTARPTPEEAEAWTTSTGLPSLQLLARLAAPSGGGPFVDRTLKPALAALASPVTGPLAIYGRYREVLEVLVTDAGTLRSLDHHTVLGLREAWPDDRRYKLAKDAAKVLATRLGDWADRVRAARRLPTEADRALLDALEPFARWVRAAAITLGRRLDQQRRLTFEEMQRRAIRAVLADEGLRTTLRERFRYLMVDEFQDTDERQWALVRALGRADPRVPEDRVFLVGDPKQAIYGFRGGDVTVFRRAMDELHTTPIALAENFRSKPELIAWFNDVFPKVLDPGTPYETLTARRLGTGGAVTVLRGPADTFDAPDATARWIALALASPLADRAVYPTPPIAILLRSRTRQDRYEAALRRYGVPYVVASGVGFWSRPEVVDVVNLVCAVAHGDPVSIVGAQRSPLGTVTDQQVQDGGQPSVFVHWLARRRQVSPSALIREIVADGVPTWAATDPSGQAQANVDRLASLVGPWDSLGLAAVADRLLAEVESASRESEASLVATEARVIVCTVHAAKGLEFPVVVVPELSARPANDAPTLLVARIDSGFRIASQVLDPDAAVETRVKPGLYSTLAQIRRTEQDAEERRLLYVAATRARDQLVLVGVEQKPADPGARPSWMQLVDAVLPRTTVVSGTPPEPPPLPAPAPRSIPPTDRWAPLPPRRALELSASALDRFTGCPARWMRGDLLGIPESPASARDRAQALAAARGQVLHHVLEDRVEDDPVAVRTRWSAAAAALAASPGEIGEGHERLVAHLTVTAADPDVVRALTAPGWSEVPFRATHRGIALHGRIDRLWFDARAGGFVVLDWKSEALHGRPPEGVARRHTTQLRAYAWAADRVCRARDQGRVIRGEIVLTEVGRVVASPWGDGDLEDIPVLLEEMASVAERPWTEVEAGSTTGDVARPCGECGFRGRGCRGVS